MVAYEEMLEQCSPAEAPWQIVPADRKWYRNYAVAKTVVETLRDYKAEWLAKLETIGATRIQELKALREGQPNGA